MGGDLPLQGVRRKGVERHQNIEKPQSIWTAASYLHMASKGGANTQICSKRSFGNLSCIGSDPLGNAERKLGNFLMIL